MDERDLDALIYHLRLRSVPGAFKADQYARWLGAIAALRARAEQAERSIRVIANDALTLDECKSVARTYEACAQIAIDRARSQGEGTT